MTDDWFEQYRARCAQLRPTARTAYANNPTRFRVGMSKLTKSEQRQVRRWVERGTVPHGRGDLIDIFARGGSVD